jgi:hypothetical protein
MLLKQRPRPCCLSLIQCKKRKSTTFQRIENKTRLDGKGYKIQNGCSQSQTYKTIIRMSTARHSGHNREKKKKMKNNAPYWWSAFNQDRFVPWSPRDLDAATPTWTVGRLKADTAGVRCSVRPTWWWVEVWWPTAPLWACADDRLSERNDFDGGWWVVVWCEIGISTEPLAL